MTEPIDYKLPTVEEILAGATQAGVPKPPSLFADADDGTVQRVGAAPVFAVDPAVLEIVETRSYWICELSARPLALTRWQACKALLRVIFGWS